jgi:Escherichia/Staphylococcus phage prohead protease
MEKIRMKNNLERRILKPSSAGVTFRGADDGERILTGMAIVYDQDSDYLGFYEQIAPGAATEALKISDVRFLISHNAELILGRTKSGTLELTENQYGVRFVCRLADDSPLADTAFSTVKRRDTSGCSFKFTASTVEGDDEWTRDEEGEWHRRIYKIDNIYDFCITAFPAYPSTYVNSWSASRSAGRDRNSWTTEEQQRKYDQAGDLIARLSA